MTAERIALVGTALAVVVLAAFWIVGDERFGRPAGGSGRSARTQDMPIGRPSASDTLTARFALCDGPIRRNCVVDGDTFWFKGDKIRIADIDAPEISSPHCADEKIVGEVARDRLLEFLNAVSFSLRYRPIWPQAAHGHARQPIARRDARRGGIGPALGRAGTRLVQELTAPDATRRFCDSRNESAGRDRFMKLIGRGVAGAGFFADDRATLSALCGTD